MTYSNDGEYGYINSTVNVKKNEVLYHAMLTRGMLHFGCHALLLLFNAVVHEVSHLVSHLACTAHNPSNGLLFNKHPLSQTTLHTHMAMLKLVCVSKANKGQRRRRAPRGGTALAAKEGLGWLCRHLRHPQRLRLVMHGVIFALTSYCHSIDLHRCELTGYAQVHMRGNRMYMIIEYM